MKHRLFNLCCVPVCSTTPSEYVGERRAERREQQHHGLQETLLVQALVGSIWDACATTWRKLLAAPLHVQPVRAPQKFRQPCGGILRWSESPVVYSDGQSHPWPNIQHHYITSYHMFGLCALSDQCHRETLLETRLVHSGFNFKGC